MVKVGGETKKNQKGGRRGELLNREPDDPAGSLTSLCKHCWQLQGFDENRILLVDASRRVKR